MNLLVAPEEGPTVVDVRRGGRDALGRRIGAGHRLAQRQAGAGIRVHEPHPHPVPVGRRRPIRAPWLTAVFDIDPEHHAPLGALAVGHRVVPRAREADLVGRRAPRLGATDAVARIAQATHHPRCVRIFRTGEAGAFQTVEAARVEVAVQPLPNVTHVRPLAGDARGVCRERRRDPDRRAHLTSMRGVDRRARTGVGRTCARRVGITDGVIRAARIYDPATGYPTAEQSTHCRERGNCDALPGARVAHLAGGVGAGRGYVRLHAVARLAARRRAGVVIVVRARRAVGDVDVRLNAHARLAARGLAATGDGGDGVAGVVGRAGRAVRHVDVGANTLARLAAGGLAAPGDGRDGAASVVDRARRAVGDVDVGANTLARLAAGGLAAAGDGRDGVAGGVGRAGGAVGNVDVGANTLPRLAAGGLAAARDGGDGGAGV